MLSYLLATTISLSPAQVFDTAVAFARNHPSFTVDVLANGTDHCTLTVHRPDRLRFEIRRPDYNYVVARDGNHATELSRTERIYAEALVGPKLDELESQVSDLEAADFPALAISLNLQTFTQHFNPTVTAMPNGDQKVEGSTPDAGSVSVIFDKLGRMIHYEFHLISPNGNLDGVFAFSNYRDEEKGSFSLVAPIGYSAYYMPMAKEPVPTGRMLPGGTWQNGSGESVDLLGSLGDGPTLVAVLDMDAAPSIRAANHLPDLAVALKGHAKVVALSAKKLALSGVRVLTDSGGKSLRSLIEPGAPLYYLVKGGHILRIWLGDSDDARSSVEQDMVSAATNIK